jgi:hypothetical protein
MKNCSLNKVFKITFITLLVYIYINTQLWITCICMVYIIGFTFKIQINYMWFLQELKWVKFYMLLLWYFMYFWFSKNYLCRTMHLVMTCFWRMSKHRGVMCVCENFTKMQNIKNEFLVTIFLIIFFLHVQLWY